MYVSCSIFTCGMRHSFFVAANHGQPTDSADAYDPIEEKWTTLPNTLGVHASCVSAVLPDHGFCLIGGLARGEGCSKKVELLHDT